MSTEEDESEGAPEPEIETLVKPDQPGMEEEKEPEEPAK